MSGVLFCQTQAWSLSLSLSAVQASADALHLSPLQENMRSKTGERAARIIEWAWMTSLPTLRWIMPNLWYVCVCSEKTYMQLAQEWSHQTPNIWQVFFRFFIQAQSRSINAPWAQHPPYFRFATSPVTWSSPTLAAPTAGIASVTLRNAPDSSRTLACKDSQTSCWPLAWSMGCTSAVWSKLWGNIAIPSEGY